MSALSVRQSPAAPLTEDQMFFGYRNCEQAALADALTRSAARSEPCACGGVIRVPLDAPQFVRPAVEEHQRSVSHRIWRQRMGIDDLTSRSAQPTTPKAARPVDVSGEPRQRAVCCAERGCRR